MPPDQSVQAASTVDPTLRLTATYAAPDEYITMTKYHLLLVLERLQRRPSGPPLELVAVPGVLFIGLLVTLLPSDFQSFGGISGVVWEAIIIISTFLSAIATVILLIWWVAARTTRQTPEDVVEDIIEEMETIREKLSISSTEGS